MERKSITAVCLVDVDNPKLQDLLRDYYGCEIVGSGPGCETTNREEIVYLFSDFESVVFKEFVKKSPAKPAISSTLVLSRHHQRLPLLFPRPRRPLYCELLNNCNIVIRAGNVGEKIPLSSIVRYMGGHVKRELHTNTTFLVTDQARGKAFRQFVSLGKSVLLPSWLHECWAHRDDFDFDPRKSELISKHRIGVFESLKIFVYGFNEFEDEDIKRNVIQNRGSIVTDFSEATHCVINSSTLDLSTLPPFKDQKLVTNEWVWMSISIQYCANEKLYHPGPQYPQDIVGPAESNDAATSRSSVSEGVGDKVQKVYKAYRICCEIFETEVSYVDALSLLLSVKEYLEVDHGSQLINKSEVSLIFGKISPIIVVHQGIIVHLKELLKNWKSGADVAQIWIDAFDDLNRVYAPYLNTYETAVDALAAADKANPRLHAYLRAMECSKEFKRNTFKDLLIRPVQRIPTLIVLLKELENKSKSERKSEKIKEAIVLMDKVVSRANDVRAQNDDFIQQLSFFNEVEGVPPHLMCSRRKLLMSVEASSICGTQDWHNLSRRKVKIFLFNELIMVCKIRIPHEKTRTLNRLAGRSPFSSSSEQRRPYKYFAHLLIPHVREINRLKLFHYGGTVSDRLEPSDVSGDSSWYTEAINKSEMLDFVAEIHKKIFMDFGRDILWPGFSITDVPTSSTRNALVKHIKKMVPREEYSIRICDDDKPSAFASLRRRSADSLRRTVSHIGAITRRPIPSSFRSLTRSTSNDGERCENSKLSVLSLCGTTNLESSQESPYEDQITGSLLATVEESEPEILDYSDKEN